MRNLIVNADDFGFTTGVNRAVIDGHTRGIITSTTIMANMPAFAEAVRLAKEHPSLGVGLHFNITQGKPIAPASQVRSLLNERDEFPGTSTAIARRLLIGGLRRDEIVIELRAQLEKVLDAGLPLTHVDSHKHSHALPQVFDAILSALPQYNLRAVRLQHEQGQFDGTVASFKLMRQRAVSFALAQLCRQSRHKLQRAGLRSTEAFFGITQTGFWTKRWLCDLLEQLPAGTSELMCHPGYADSELNEQQTRLTYSRETELRLLMDADIRAVLEKQQINLVTYAMV